MSEFTKGTWNVGIDEKYGPYVYADDGDAIIAVIRSCGHMSESDKKETVRQANARLIAAAPEMYELLRNFIAIDEMKAEASTDKNDPLYMRALVEQDRAVNLARKLLARINGEEVKA